MGTVRRLPAAVGGMPISSNALAWIGVGRVAMVIGSDRAAGR